MPTAPAEVTMPEFGESVTSATVTRWLKNVGDTVEVDEPLLEVSTDKVDTEVPSPVAGLILELLAAEDDTVDVGDVLARIGQPADHPDQRDHPAPPDQPDHPAHSDHPAPLPASRPDEPVQPPEEPARDSGDTAAAAEEKAVPAKAEPATAPTAPQPTTPAGDAPSTAPSRPAAAPVATDGGRLAGTAAPMSRLRQIIAQRMTESLAVSAQLTSVQEVDVTRIVRLRQRAKLNFERNEGVKLTFLPFFAKAVIEALGAFPAFNASVSADGKSVTYHREVHLAVAVDTPRGLLVPVIPNAQHLGLGGLARKIADVADRARSNSIKADELSGGTFTITNIGSVGALFDTPIINQPQVAILATGAIFRRPAVIAGPDGEDQFAVRSVCYLPLTYDHRIIDGADAGRFVGAVRARLEKGAFEADLGD
jgi:pyruvate dehydrogenase E2 component (dihydrolipoamide acetyltransferase)